MQASLLVLLARGTGPTGRTEMSLDVALTANELGRWQILKTGEAFSGIGSILTGSEHARLLFTNKGGTPI
jgi:hypothetical protein